jgi:hypothetical protein
MIISSLVAFDKTLNVCQFFTLLIEKLILAIVGSDENKLYTVKKT